MGWHPTPFVLDKALGVFGLSAQGWEQMWGESGVGKPPIPDTLLSLQQLPRQIQSPNKIRAGFSSLGDAGVDSWAPPLGTAMSRATWPVGIKGYRGAPKALGPHSAPGTVSGQREEANAIFFC